MTNPDHPSIALVQGDACGIGPELTAKLLASDGVGESARILILSDQRVFAAGCQVAGVDLAPPVVNRIEDADLDAHSLTLLHVPGANPAEITPGEVSAVAGAAVIDCLGRALDACKDGHLHGLCFTPFNKQAMHLAGLDAEDETQWAKARIGFEGRVSEFNVIEGMWNARVTSHVPLKDVGGLPFPMATPAHGTAFDIVGRNIANVEPTRRAMDTVVTMARAR